MLQTTHNATCPLDCPSACALKITIEANRLQSVRGNKAHPFTRGVICGKVSRYREIQDGPRITTPLIRCGAKGSGTFREASWDATMDLAVKKIQDAMEQWGAESVFPFYYAGTMGMVQRYAIDRLTHRAGFSRMDGTICYPIGFAGWRAGVGQAFGPNPTEIADSDLVILWGINAAVTHITMMADVKKARQNGARLIVVDPYRNQTAKLADQHLNPRPGTDGALATAILHVLLEENLIDRDYLAKYTDFDAELADHLRSKTPEWAASITGMTPQVIRAFAIEYGRARAPFIRLGLGMSRQNNGAVNVHAVSCLPALTGAWQRRGGGALFATGDAFHLNLETIRQVAWHNGASRILDMSRLGDVLTSADLSPAVRVLLTFSANPAGSCPDLNRVHQGLRREDLFTVVHEQMMTDTAHFADIIWPATTFLEQEDLFKSYGQYTLQHSKQILPPLGQARCNHDVVNELAQKLGFREESFTWNSGEMVQRVLASSDYPPAATWKTGSYLDCTPSWEKGHFLHGFPQHDGKFHFYPGWSNINMPKMPDHWPVNRRDLNDKSDPYPLDFMTPPTLATLNTTFAYLPAVAKRQGSPRLWLHPQDAANRKINHNDTVVVFNQLGRLTMLAFVTEDVRPGLCLCESNFPGQAFPEGVSLNALSHATTVAPDGGAAFHDNRVEVVKLDQTTATAR